MKGVITIELEEDYLDCIRDLICSKTTNEIRAFLIGKVDQCLPLIFDPSQVKQIRVNVERTKQAQG